MSPPVPRFSIAAPLQSRRRLFLFYVKACCAAPGWEGPLLVLFSLSAAVAGPVLGKTAKSVSRPQARIAFCRMRWRIVVFRGALLLGVGDLAVVVLVCLAPVRCSGPILTLSTCHVCSTLWRLWPTPPPKVRAVVTCVKFSLAFAAICASLPPCKASGFDSAARAIDLLAISTPHKGFMPVCLAAAKLNCHRVDGRHAAAKRMTEI